MKTITVNGTEVVCYESTNLNTGIVTVHVVDYLSGRVLDTQVVRVLPGFPREPEGVSDVLCRVFRQIGG